MKQELKEIQGFHEEITRQKQEAQSVFILRKETDGKN